MRGDGMTTGKHFGIVPAGEQVARALTAIHGHPGRAPGGQGERRVDIEQVVDVAVIDQNRVRRAEFCEGGGDPLRIRAGMDDLGAVGDQGIGQHTEIAKADVWQPEPNQESWRVSA